MSTRTHLQRSPTHPWGTVFRCNEHGLQHGTQDCRFWRHAVGVGQHLKRKLLINQILGRIYRAVLGTAAGVMQQICTTTTELEHRKTVISFEKISPLAIGVVLVGCATTGENHAIPAAIGKILETHASSSAAVSGTYVQGSHNPLHKLVSVLAAESAHTIYVIETQGGVKRYVRQQERFEIGTCVEVRTSKERAAEESWKLGEATLAVSSACGS